VVQDLDTTIAAVGDPYAPPSLLCVMMCYARMPGWLCRLKIKPMPRPTLKLVWTLVDKL